jgi:hypothetical protein
MNKPDTLEIVNLIKRLPNSPITDRDSLNETVNLFFAVLGDLPADMAKAATIQYLSEGNPFFPMPGVLRDKAMELQMLAAGLPTAGEAWGMVLTANRPANPVFCDEGARLRDAVNNAATYWSSLKEYSRHVDECDVCDLGGYRENYRHPAVAETVKMLGGRDAILTDNPAADRARFLEAYREVIAREKMKMGMTPRVAEFVENSRPALVSGELKQLSARLSK